jgi:NAD-dependent deacetylase
VVWFGEALPAEPVRRAFEAARQAEVVLVIGTSSVVYPAAAIPEMARQAGAYVVEVNPEPTPLTAVAHASLRGTAAAVVPGLVGSA